MRSSLLCLLLSFLCLALALSGLPTVSARNSFLRTHWASSKAVPANTLHRLRFGLKQQNTEQLKAFVERVSDPQHEQYGQYMTLQEIAEWIAPSDEKLAQFESILYKAGALNVTITQSRDFASVLLPVKSIQRLFQTPAGTKLHLHTHTHVHSGRNVLRTRHGAEFVMVPELEEHVELVTGLSDFFDFPSERKAAKAAANLRAQEASFHAKEKGQLNACSNSAPDFGRIKNSHEDVLVSVIIYCQNGHTTGDVSSPCADFPPAAQSITLRLIPRAHPMQVVQMNVNQLDCQINAASQVECTFPKQDFPAWGRMRIDAQVTYVDSSTSMIGIYGSGFAPSPYVTPDTILSRYSVPLGTRGLASNNSQSVVAFEDQFIDVQGDYRKFCHELGLPFEAPIMDGLNDPTQPGGESTLDIQYISAVGQGITTTFMSLSNAGPAGSGGPAKPPGDGAYILEWAAHISDMQSAPFVTSISYGDTEDGYYTKFGSFTYIDRMEVELAKMAARGMSVLAGSGDAGVSNVGEEGNDISDTDPTCSPFRPFYPSNSPYVTSVSSTFLSTNYLPVCQSNLVPSLPIVCQQIGEIAVGVSQGLFWTTGGGFSNRSDVNPQPSWQQAVVQNYLNTAILPPAGVFNARGRGYPDVATIGHNLLMHFAGNLTTVDGTSASGPVMAGLISLLNDYRLRAGKPTMGLLNPFLYQSAASETSAFMDVTVGHNNDGDIQPKCGAYPSTCPDGFKTAPGWNPVTGLGTPNWSVLKTLAMAVAEDDFPRTKFE